MDDVLKGAKQIIDDQRNERTMLLVVAIVFLVLATIPGYTAVVLANGIGIVVFGTMTAVLISMAVYVLVVFRRTR